MRFNQVLQTDVYNVKWNDKRVRIISLMDEFSRFEREKVILRETTEDITRCLEELWFNVFGPPEVLRLDAAGGHSSEAFSDFCSRFGVRLIVVPAGAHFKLGMIERNHAVRRKQITLYERDFPDDDVDHAVDVTCGQRNRLRDVGGSTPLTLVFGSAPRMIGDLSSENFQLGEQSSFLEHESALATALARKTSAAKAFLEARACQGVRAALVARSRAPRFDFRPGDWVYYWRDHRT